MFSCEGFEFTKGNFFTEHLRWLLLCGNSWTKKKIYVFGKSTPCQLLEQIEGIKIHIY